MDASAAESLLQTAEAARTRMRGFDAAAAKEEVERDYEAMLAALDWYLENEQRDRAFRLASALVPFWMATKRIDEGDRWFARAWAAAASRPARALYDHGYLVFWAGRYDVARERFAEARAVAQAEGDVTVVALALAGAARVALNDDVHEAVRLLREALAVTEGTDDREGRSSAMHVLGVALQMAGDLEGAGDVMSQRIEIGRTLRFEVADREVGRETRVEDGVGQRVLALEVPVELPLADVGRDEDLLDAGSRDPLSVEQRGSRIEHGLPGAPAARGGRLGHPDTVRPAEETAR